VRALLALLAALGTPDVVAPPVVDWRDAGERAGQVVTVEGEVRAAHCSEDRCILEFAPEDPRGFRVVLLMPMFSRATDTPDAMYGGRRIRATGKVQRFQGRVEMVLRGTSQIELTDTTPTAPMVATPSTTRPSSPPPTTPPATLPPPTTPPATTPPAAPMTAPLPSTLPPATPPPPAPSTATTAVPPPAATAPAPQPTPTTPPVLAEPPPPEPADDARVKAAACDRAKARWREVASDVRTHTTSLERCFRALPYRCHPESAALAAVLPLLDEAERQVEATCR
jgi:hypothetical protein